MRPGDLDAVARLADQIHPALPEPPDVFADRMKVWPAGALVLECGGHVCGYAIGHPIRLGDPPALGSIVGETPDNPDAFYIHDVAIAPQMRGRALARDALARLLAGAPAGSRACLIAVYGTAAFWARYGFKAASGLVPHDKLATYGPDAVFMVRDRGCRPDAGEPQD